MKARKEPESPASKRNNNCSASRVGWERPQEGFGWAALKAVSSVLKSTLPIATDPPRAKEFDLQTRKSVGVGKASLGQSKEGPKNEAEGLHTDCFILQTQRGKQLASHGVHTCHPSAGEAEVETSSRPANLVN